MSLLLGFKSNPEMENIAIKKIGQANILQLQEIGRKTFFETF